MDAFVRDSAAAAGGYKHPQASDLWEEVGRDDEAEKILLAAIILHPEWIPNVPCSSFYLGQLGFHGWLFGRVRTAKRMRQDVLTFVLNSRSRSAARDFGVQNLAAEVALVLADRSGRGRYNLDRNLVRSALHRVRQAARARRIRWQLEDRSSQLIQNWKDYRTSRIENTTG